MSFGSILLELRTEKGIYQKELASYLRVSISTISNYEKDRYFPDPSTLCQIADFFGVTTDYLLGRNHFRFDPELLSRPFTDAYTVSDFVNTSLELSPKHKHALAEYAEMLTLREQVESPGE